MAIMPNNECLKKINQDILRSSHLLLNKGRQNRLCIDFRYNTAYWNAKLILQGILKSIEIFPQYRTFKKKHNKTNHKKTKPQQKTKTKHCHKTQQKIQSIGDAYHRLLSQKHLWGRSQSQTIFSKSHIFV